MARIDKSKAAGIAATEDLSSAAARIEAMLKRWEAEDVSDEPDWDPEDIEPIALAGAASSRATTGGSS